MKKKGTPISNLERRRNKSKRCRPSPLFFSGKSVLVAFFFSLMVSCPLSASEDWQKELDNPTLNALLDKLIEQAEAAQKGEPIPDWSDKAKPILNYGRRGPVFPIAEHSFLEMMQSRLREKERDGTLDKLSEHIQKKTEESLRHPKAIHFLPGAERSRSWTWDPTRIQTTPIHDHEGNVVVAANTRINPLDHLDWGEALLFFDGEDRAQTEWITQQEGTPVMTKGAPLDLMQKWQRPVYFDLRGTLVSLFQITALPARITQQGRKLLIEEVAI